MPTSKFNSEALQVLLQFPNLALLSLHLGSCRRKENIIMLGETLARCHTLTSFSCNDSVLILHIPILYNYLPQCLLLERLDLRDSVKHLFPILPQCRRLTTVYLGEFYINNQEIVITILYQCSRLNFIKFTVISPVNSPPNYTSKLRDDLLKIFTSVDITCSHISYKSYIVTASGRR